MNFDKIFSTDVIGKLERVELTLNHKPIDRVAILEQLSYNPDVIARVTGRKIEGYNYTVDDICEVIRKTTDMIMPPVPPKGNDTYTDIDGFVFKNDNWMTWRVSSPFKDENGAKGWLTKRIQRLRDMKCDHGIVAYTCAKELANYSEAISTEHLKNWYQDYMRTIQRKIGDTVILNYSQTNFCSVFNMMGIEIFTYFYYTYPDILQEFMEVSTETEIRRINAVADVKLSPVILIPEDFSHKGGLIFDPEMLGTYHYPYIKKLANTWHEHGVKVLYHSDGFYKPALPQLMSCGVDGFYCLEINAMMDVVELKNTYPDFVWAGGVDGVDLMELGTTSNVKAEVHRHIVETNVLNTGGMFVATSSEINPPIGPDNFCAMIEACGEVRNPNFGK